jgi:hypothetical protein
MEEIEPLGGPGGAPFETAPAGTTPVATGGAAATPPPPRRRGLLRWGIALAVLVVMVGVVSVAASLLAGGGGTSAVGGWIPKGTVAYLEIRADMPGDQRANVGNLLARFPGFADQASNDAKIDEALDRLLAGTGSSWTADVKPWLGGEIGVAITSPALDLAGNQLGDMQALKKVDDGAVLLVAVKDGALAKAWVLKQMGGTQAVEPYTGGDITVMTGPRGGTLAFAVRGSVMVLGPLKAVKASLDTGGSSPVATTESFAAARKTAPSAYLGFGYLDASAFVKAALAAAGSQPGIPAACLDPVAAKIPAWAAGSARAEDGALVFTMTAKTAGPASTAKDRASASAIASHLPASTVAAIEVRDLGTGLVGAFNSLKTTLACDPAAAQAMDQVEQALAAVGGAEALIGWAGDTALAATVDGTAFGAGLAATVADEAKAGRVLDQLKVLVTLGGAGAGLASREEAYGAGKLLVVTIPPGALSLAAGPDIAVTVQGGVFALGTIDFVKAVVDTTAAGSLAKDPVYERAIALAGGDGVIGVFIDLAGIRAGVEAMAPAEAKASYDTEIKPFLVPLEAFASVVRASGATAEIRAVITFTK